MKTRIALLLAVALCVVLAVYPRKARSEPMAAVEQGGVRIVVHTEKCVFKEVSNLTNRATWEEGGKVIEGCAGVFSQIGLVLFYFADKSVVAVPMQLFSRVSNS